MEDNNDEIRYSPCKELESPADQVQQQQPPWQEPALVVLKAIRQHT